MAVIGEMKLTKATGPVTALGAQERGSEMHQGHRCKLLHLEWINNKVLPYSPGNYTQYPVINPNGKGYEKRMSVCV